MSDLHVVERGSSADGPAVLLVHGSMDRGAAMVAVSRLLEGCHVLWYDRRGYGRSLHAGPAGIDGHVDDLLELAGDGPAVVAGHSYGGVVGLVAAARRPDVVRSVLAYEAPMPWQPWWPSDSPGGSAVSAGHAGGGGDAGAAAAAEAFLRRMLGDEAWEMMPAKAKEQRRAEGEALVTELASLRTSPAYRPQDLTVPVIAGRGTQSPEHLRRAAAELASGAPDGELAEVDGASHGAHRTDPEAFADLVRRAIARCGQSG